MAHLVTYKMLSKKVDIVIRIIDDCKRKNKPLAEFYILEIISKIDQYYRFERITIDARNYFTKRLAIIWNDSLK